MYPHPIRFIVSIFFLLLNFCNHAAASGLFEPSTFLADTVPPEITCPANVTITLPSNRCDTAYQYTVQFMDDQPGATLVQAQGLPPGGKFPIGTTVNLYVALDAAGNTATCSFRVVVIPVSGALQCKDDIVVKLDNDCSYLPPITTFLEPNTFGCPTNYFIEVDKTPPFGNGPWLPALFKVEDINKYYQFRVTDLTSGNKCWGQALIVDSMPPAITCPNINTNCSIESVSPAFLKDSLGYASAFPVVTDNCQLSPNPPVFVDILSDLPCNPASNGVRRQISRIWTATDAVGNKSTCMQIISLKATPSDIVFPADTTFYDCQAQTAPITITGMPYFQVGLRRYPVIQSQICDIDANYFDTLVPVALCAGARRIQRTWKLYDLCGQQPLSNYPTIGVQMIDIVDTTGPVIACPANVTLELATQNCTTQVDLPDFVLSDQCTPLASLQATFTLNGITTTIDGIFMDIPGAPVSGYDTLGVVGAIDDVPSGITSVVYTATDACGNSSICAFKLHVWDQQAPVAICDTFPKVFLTGGFVTDVQAAIFDHSSVDACTDIDFRARRQNAGACQANTQFYKQLRFCCADIGDTIPIVLRVYDVQLPGDSVAATFANGQFSDCVVQVIVRDTLPAKCAAPVDTVVLCSSFNPVLPYGAATSLSCQVDSIIAVADYSMFDTACKTGIVRRNFQTYFNGIKGGICTQKITVDFLQDYAIRFPDDVIVTDCNANNQYETPQIHQMSCEKVRVSYTDEVFTVVPDACYKIERVWKVINLCRYDSTAPLVVVPNPTPNAVVNNAANLPGPIVARAGTPNPWASSLVRIFPTDPQPTDYSVYWTANNNGFQYRQIIKIVDIKDPILFHCPSQAPVIADQSTNDPLLWNDAVFLDTLTDLTDLADAPLDSLYLSATDLCSNFDVTFRYYLWLDLNQDGIQETVLNSQLVGGSSFGAGNVPFNNYNNPNYTGGTAYPFDQRTVPNAQKYRFALQIIPDGDRRIAKIAWNTAGNPNMFIPAQIPYGRHKVKWIVEDKCGNEAVCEYFFTINDGKAPEIQCKQGVSKTVGTNHQANVTIADVAQSYSDNYIPNAQLLLSVRKVGSNTPVFLSGVGLPSAIFTCADTGMQALELWVRDLNGFESTCTAQVEIKDDAENCGNPPIGTLLDGNIRNDNNKGVANVSISIEAGGNLPFNFNMLTFTDTLGNYSVDLSPYPIPNNAVVRPSKIDDPLNGVSTFDLVLMSKHVLGLQPLGSPYKMIAADVNKSNSVTNFDIVETRKLILGIYTAFPNNNSWRFVPASHTFTNPFNPFQGGFPEFISLPAQPGSDFIAIKVGDVNTNAQTDSFSATEHRSPELAFFNTTARTFKQGESFIVHIEPAEILSGYQFSLEFSGLELLALAPESPLTPDHFAIFQNCLTGAIETGNAAFDLHFQALCDGDLSDHLRFSNLITPSEAYTPDNSVHIPILHFEATNAQENGLVLFQNVPNPFATQTSIVFSVPEAGKVQFRVLDQMGKTVYEEIKTLEAGAHSIDVKAAWLDGPGIYYYQIKTDKAQAIKKLTKF